MFRKPQADEAVSRDKSDTSHGNLGNHSIKLTAAMLQNTRPDQLTEADSTGRCNTFAEHLRGRLVAERLAQPLV